MAQERSTRAQKLVTRALQYTEKGWPVFPVHHRQVWDYGPGCSCYLGRRGAVDRGGGMQEQACDNPAKHPMTVNGLYDATLHSTIVKRWWRQDRLANVGIVTGEASNLLVLDIDGVEPKAALEAKYGTLPETATVESSRGWHYYFTWSEVDIDFPNTQGDKGGLMPHVDTRGRGGYIVAPPSEHITGFIYKWVSPKGTRPAPTPDWLVDWYQKKARRTRRSGGRKAGHQGTISDGTRNALMASRAGAMRHWGASEGAILAALQYDNPDQCDPPLTDRELERIAHSIATRYEPSWQLPEAPQAISTEPRKVALMFEPTTTRQEAN